MSNSNQQEDFKLDPIVETHPLVKLIYIVILFSVTGSMMWVIASLTKEEVLGAMIALGNIFVIAAVVIVVIAVVVILVGQALLTIRKINN